MHSLDIPVELRLLRPGQACDAQDDLGDDGPRVVRLEAESAQHGACRFFDEEGEHLWRHVLTEDARPDTVVGDLADATPQRLESASGVGDVVVVERDVRQGAHRRDFVPQTRGHAGEGDTRVRVRGGLGDEVEAFRADGDDFAQQAFTVGEVPVECTPGQARRVCDRVQRGVRILGENRLCGVEQRFVVGGGVALGDGESSVGM